MSSTDRPVSSPLLSDAVRVSGRGTEIFVRVRPKSAKTALGGLHRDPQTGRVELEISLNAPPVDGAANQLLLRFLAKALGVSRSSLTLTRGQTSRHKTIHAEEIHAEDVCRALSSALA